MGYHAVILLVLLVGCAREIAPPPVVVAAVNHSPNNTYSLVCHEPGTCVAVCVGVR